MKGNQDKVVGWMKGEPGAWGFIAGQAVIAVRGQAGRDLADMERRLVWSRMWWWLEQIKFGIGGPIYQAKRRTGPHLNPLRWLTRIYLL